MQLVEAATAQKELAKELSDTKTQVTAAEKEAADAKVLAQRAHAKAAASPPPSPAAAVSNAESEAEKQVLDMQIKTMTQALKAKEGKINELSSDKQKLENYTKKTLHAVQVNRQFACCILQFCICCNELTSLF